MFSSDVDLGDVGRCGRVKLAVGLVNLGLGDWRNIVVVFIRHKVSDIRDLSDTLAPYSGWTLGVIRLASRVNSGYHCRFGRLAARVADLEDNEYSLMTIQLGRDRPYDVKSDPQP